MTDNKQQTAVEGLEKAFYKYAESTGINNNKWLIDEEDLDKLIQQAKEMEKEEKLKLIKFTSEIFELGKSHFSYALITNEEILELYNETNETNNERNSE